MREDFVRLLDRLRLFILEKMIREEQYKQILRSLDASNGQVFEFRGYNELYAEETGLSISHFREQCRYANNFVSNNELDQNHHN